MSEQYNPGFWDQACSTPPPVRRLYLVRMLFLVVPALTLVYFFEAIGLDPIGSVPLMYLSLHGWFAVAYARNKSMGLVMVGNLLSALAASVITGFFAYILVFIHGPRTLWKLLGGSYPILTIWIMASFVIEILCSLIFVFLIFRRFPSRAEREAQEARELSEELSPPEDQAVNDHTLTKTEAQSTHRSDSDIP